MTFDITASTRPRMLVLRAHGTGTSADGHRAFTRRDDACAWIGGQAVIPVAAAAPGASRPAMTRRRVSDGVVIPYALRDRIESAVLDVNGRGCSLRLDAAAGWPADEPDFAELTVSTDYAGAARHATVDLRVSHLDDQDYVVATVITAMRAVLAGAPCRAAATGSAARR